MRLDQPFDPNSTEPTVDDYNRAMRAAGWKERDGRFKCGVHGGDNFNAVAYVGTDGKAHVQCKSQGCDLAAALRPWLKRGGQPPPDLKPQRTDLPSGPGWSRADFHYADGKLAFVEMRKDYTGDDGHPRKKIRPWIPVRGGWTQKALPSKPHAPTRPLYRLPELNKLKRTHTIHVTEGVKCANALGAAGGFDNVTTWQGGSKQWKYTDWSPLKGHPVVLYADTDDTGRDAVDGIAAHLTAAYGCIVETVREKGDSGKDIYDWLKQWRKAGLDHEEQIDRMRKRFTPPKPYTRLSEVGLRKPQWLFRGWMATGDLTLLGGKAKTGKGMLSARVAAMAQGNVPWPDGTRSPRGGSVIWCGTEDNAETALGWRLRASGVNADKVLLWTLPDDMDGRMAYLENMKLHRKHVPDDLRLIVVDPLASDMKGNQNDAGDVRTYCEAWQNFARGYDCGLLGIRHVGKWGRRTIEDASDLADMLQGSHQFVAVARATWVLVEDENDRKGPRLLVLSRKNHDEEPTHYGYRAHLGEHREWGKHVGTVEPADDATADARAMFAGGTAGNKVDEAILDALQHGERLASEVRDEVMDVTGCNQSTVSRRSTSLKKSGAIIEEGGGPGSRTAVWRLA